MAELSHKIQDCVGEVFLRWIVSIMADVALHDGPEPLDGIEMRVIGWQLDLMNVTVLSDNEEPWREDCQRHQACDPQTLFIRRDRWLQRMAHSSLGSTKGLRALFYSKYTALSVIPPGHNHPVNQATCASVHKQIYTFWYTEASV